MEEKAEEYRKLIQKTAEEMVRNPGFFSQIWQHIWSPRNVPLWYALFRSMCWISESVSVIAQAICRWWR